MNWRDELKKQNGQFPYYFHLEIEPHCRQKNGRFLTSFRNLEQKKPSYISTFKLNKYDNACAKNFDND